MYTHTWTTHATHTYGQTKYADTNIPIPVHMQTTQYVHKDTLYPCTNTQFTPVNTSHGNRNSRGKVKYM